MKNIKRAILLSAMGAALCMPRAYADVITQWNFNGASAGTVPGGVSTPSPVIGSGSASLIGGPVGSFASGIADGGSTDPVTTNPPNLAWGTTTYPAAAVGNETAGVQFLVSTVGFNNITFSFDQRASNTSSRLWAVDYTLNGTDWTRLSLDNTFASAGSGTFGTNGTFASIGGDTWFKGRSINFTGIAGVNDNANFGIRIVSSFGSGTAYAAAGTGSYATSGTSRYDMVTFNGSLLGAKNLFWNLASGGVWDTSAANWTGGATVFSNGDHATFNKVEGGTIAVTGTLTPATVTVSAASGTYTFDTASTGGKISGAASLTKSGNGILAIAGDNDFTGGTTISGGSVQIDSNLAGTLGTPLGSGAISLDGGTLQNIAASTAATIPNTVTVGSNGGTIDTGTQNLTIASMPNLAGVLTKSGAGNLVLTGNFNPGTGGGLNITTGNVVLNQTTPSTVNLAGNSTLTGNLVISNPIRFNVNNSATVSGTGEIQIVTSGTLVSQASGDAGGTIAAPIRINSTNAVSGDPGTWSGTTYTSSNFLFTIGGTANGGLTLNAPITGNGEVDLSNNSAVPPASGGGGTGFIQLNAVNTYTGNTTINANTPNVRAYSVQLGVNNALPATGLIAGTKTNLGAAVLDLNGHNQQLGYLADGGNVVPGSKSLKITNEGTADSTLSLGGTVTPGDAGFSGVIADGTTKKIAVVKNGANTQILTGANTYTGGTTVSAGVLQVGVAGGTTGSLGNGPITNNATLKVERTALTVGTIDGTGTTTVTAAGASLTASHLRQSSLAIGGTSQVNLTPSLGNKAAGVSVLSSTTGNSLSIAADGNFNTTDNDLILYYQPGQGATTLAAIQQQILDGFLGTTGVAKISSSTGAVDGDKFLVAFDNSQIGLSEWEGISLTGSEQIIAKYTFFGDMNLDGSVDAFDYSVLDGNFGTGNSWLTGDANLDGFVDAFDYSVLDGNFGKSFTPALGLGSAGLTAGLSVAAVPEPSSFVLAGVACLGFGGWQLRRRFKKGVC